MRDGLDYTDAKRFPEDKFGAVGRAGENKERYAAIAKAMAPFGAAQSKVPAARRTNWKGMDDIGFEIFQGNYELYLHQIAANETSQGLWRVGSKDQMYGRFARRFDHESGKDIMFFDIEDAFFGEPLQGRYEVEVRVVYFDEGRGKWALKYDAVSNPDKTALEVTKTGTSLWKAVRVTLTDAYFGNRGARQSDLALVNLDTENDTFHLIEITRNTGDRKGYWGE